MYDFETVPDRGNGESIKWNSMKKRKPEVGKDIVPFSIADMEFVCIPEIRDALTDYLKTAVLGYQTAGPAFYQAVGSWTERRYGREARPEWIITMPGIVNAFFHGVMAFSEPGDGVIVMTPVYYPFYRAIEKNGRRVVRCPLIEQEGRYTIDFDRFRLMAGEMSNRLLLFSNPHNPVGRVWTREELEQVGEICRENGIFVISDEIHCDLIMPGQTFTSFTTVSSVSDAERMVCISPSKTFNLAGMNTGIVIIPDAKQKKKYRKAMEQSSLEGRVNALGYKACEAAYTRCDDWLSELIEVIWGNHLRTEEFFRRKNLPVRVCPLEGTYLQWLDLRAMGWTAEEQERRMIDADLFLDEGCLFGPEGEGFTRLNLACPRKVLDAALERFAQALSSE